MVSDDYQTANLTSCVALKPQLGPALVVVSVDQDPQRVHQDEALFGRKRLQEGILRPLHGRLIPFQKRASFVCDPRNNFTAIGLGSVLFDIATACQPSGNICCSRMIRAQLKSERTDIRSLGMLS